MMVKYLKKIIENNFGIKIFRSLPFGFDFFYDVKSIFPDYKFEIVFDVGANIGQSAKEFSLKFPEATIYCFEPSSVTFLSLQKNISSLKNIRSFKLAFSEEPGEMKMSTKENSKQNKLIDENYKSQNVTLEKVKVETIDNFCNQNSIEKISFLKIDTEGNDFKVLKSARDTISKSSIDFIEVETGMNAKNDYHVPSEVIKNFMEQNNYYLFGIYEQVHEFKIKKPVLRRTNQIYISKNLSEF